ncbi:chemotaxis-specific protein-glutamate methyltransferase CheB [Qipengyuania zhejiangensis]|uniref:chemotaxis-specific protein-glutamate methyltransferase CheB n=1 Tax=Qipengyuania zhejiangensis TaxID=3077782 RepID=UPI002D77F115|nr:chemotaxis-specific protein-glutamate methyltransferase CheB [Qipengyuania sp. Z2]
MAAVLQTKRIDPLVTVYPGTVRVMIVDDSLTVRTVFTRMIQKEPDMAIVASANSAERGLDELGLHQVDVILLDLEMPGMGGIEALPKILKAAPKAQVLVISSLTADGAEHTVKALALGAADTMLKPRPGGFNDDYRDTLLGKIRALAGKDMPAPEAPAKVPASPRIMGKRPEVIAIGASTGGIHALNLFLRKVPRNFDLPILITQHLPDSFIPVFAKQMEMAAGREAVLADEGVEIRRGTIVIAPGRGHMVVRKSGTRLLTGLAYHPVKSGCMPSVDPMFETLAEACEGRVAGVLLSGMGRDGTDGAQAIAAAGGTIYAQNAETCAVWGMPRAVTESGLAAAVLPPEGLAERVLASAGASAWT